MRKKDDETYAAKENRTRSEMEKVRFSFAGYLLLRKLPLRLQLHKEQPAIAATVPYIVICLSSYSC